MTNMKIYAEKTIWFVTGSQHLYGPRVLEQVRDNSRKIAAGLSASDAVSAEIIARDIVTTPGEIVEVCRQANSDPKCGAPSRPSASR